MSTRIGLLDGRTIGTKRGAVTVTAQVTVYSLEEFEEGRDALVDYWDRYCAHFMRLCAEERDPEVLACVRARGTVGPAVRILLRKEGFRYFAPPGRLRGTMLADYLVGENLDLVTRRSLGFVHNGWTDDEQKVGVRVFEAAADLLDDGGQLDGGSTLPEASIVVSASSPEAAADRAYRRRSKTRPPRIVSPIESGANRLAALAVKDGRAAMERVNELVASSSPEAHELLAALATTESFDWSEPWINRYAAWQLATFGPAGIRTLASKLVSNGDDLRVNRAGLLRTLSDLAAGRDPVRSDEDLPLRRPPLTEECARAAKAAFRDAVIQCEDDQLLRAAMASLLAEDEFAQQFFATIRESSITITADLLMEFGTLLREEHAESRYQQFLRDNPVFLDALAKRVDDEIWLGSDLRTDFVVQQVTGEYVLVEIEKPQDRPFTQKCDFTKEFSHALGQVLEFQDWVEQYPNYAERTMPGVAAPRGLLVIGMRARLSDRERRKLARFNANSVRVEVVCFDDLLDRARRLYDNLTTMASPDEG